MKSNPFLTVLFWIGVGLMVVGVVAFLASLIATNDFHGKQIAVKAALVAGISFPGGFISFVLWLAASGIVWQPGVADTRAKAVADKEDWGEG